MDLPYWFTNSFYENCGRTSFVFVRVGSNNIFVSSIHRSRHNRQVTFYIQQLYYIYDFRCRKKKRKKSECPTSKIVFRVETGDVRRVSPDQGRVSPSSPPLSPTLVFPPLHFPSPSPLLTIPPLLGPSPSQETPFAEVLALKTYLAFTLYFGIRCLYYPSKHCFSPLKHNFMFHIVVREHGTLWYSLMRLTWIYWKYNAGKCVSRKKLRKIFFTD